MGRQKIDELIVEVGAEVKGLRTDFNKVKSELDKLEGKVKKSSNAFAGMGGIIAGALSVGVVILFTKKINDLAVSIQATNQKALIVFGDQLGRVTAEAENNAIQMGLTTNEYIKGAAAMQDLLVPLKFTREEAANMSTEVLNLSGALSVWTGGTKSATEVSEILTKALLGENEQLKILGVTVRQDDQEFIKLVKTIKVTEKVTLNQARAMATLQQISEKTTDAQTNFTEGVKTMAQQQAEASAQVRTLAEDLAIKLTPAIIGATTNIGEFLDRFNDATKLAAQGASFTTFFQMAAFGASKSQTKTLAWVDALNKSVDALIANAKTAEDLNKIHEVLYDRQQLDWIEKGSTAYNVLNDAIDKVVASMGQMNRSQAFAKAQADAASAEVNKNGESINSLTEKLKDATAQWRMLGRNSEGFLEAAVKVSRLTSELNALKNVTRPGTIDISKVAKLEFDRDFGDFGKDKGPQLSGVDEETQAFVNAQADKAAAHKEFVLSAMEWENKRAIHQQEVLESSMIISQALADSFTSVTDSMLADMSRSENAGVRFAAALAKTAIKLISIALATSLANSISGATEAGKATGPASPITTPIFIATAIAGVIGAFATIPSLEHGGLAFGRSLVEVGEYSGASGNPEVIAPLDKLKSIIGNNNKEGFNKEVVFRIEGVELVGVLRNFHQEQRF